MHTGYNHNIHHCGIVFHIQTEDGGMASPQIVTHVFVGGNILASKRSNYQKFVGAADLDKIVLTMMQEQHKQMLKDLVQNRIRSIVHYIQTQGKDLVQNIPPELAEGIDHVVSGKPSTPSQGTGQGKKLKEEEATRTLDEMILEILKKGR